MMKYIDEALTLLLLALMSYTFTELLVASRNAKEYYKIEMHKTLHELAELDCKYVEELEK